MSHAKQKLNALLNQYAQQLGFADMQDLKNNYTPKAYGVVVGHMVLRALADEGFDQDTIDKVQEFNKQFM